jgi:hypothetical protein
MEEQMPSATKHYDQLPEFWILNPDQDGQAAD